MKEKFCYSCSKTFPLTHEFFYKKTSAYDGFQSECKKCTNAKSKAHYEANKADYIERAAVRKAVAKTQHDELKQSLSCCVCGEAEPCCLDFHHLDASQKEYSLSHIIGHSIAKVKAEIAKCVVICSNCHRKFHAGKIQLPTSVTIRN